MSTSAKAFVGLIVVALVLSLAGCGNGTGKTSADPSLSLRTYTVPDARARDVSNALDKVFGGGKSPIGRAWVAGPGQILVLAPKQMQASIGAAINKLAGENPHPAKALGPFRLDAWVVDASPGQGPSDPSLKAIAPALESFVKATGPAHFVQAHYLTALSDIDATIRINPSVAYGLMYTLERRADSLELAFNYHREAYDNKRHSGRTVGLDGKVTVQLGQTLVLGLISEGGDDKSSAKTEGSKAAAGGPAQAADAVRQLLVVRLTPVNQD